MRKCCALALVLVGSWCLAQEPAVTEAAKKTLKANVESLNAAMFKGDYDKVIELTHPKLTALIGGKEIMTAAIKTTFEGMKSQGIVLNKVTVDAPTDSAKAGDELFMIVPFDLELKVPQGKLRQKSFVIGISSDEGKTWTLLNGDVDRTQLKKLIPTLPDALKLPAKQAPKIEKE